MHFLPHEHPRPNRQNHNGRVWPPAWGAPPQVLLGKYMRILVVDDMAIVRDPIAATLRAAGHETVCAINGKEALAALTANCPDLILLDIHLPDVCGLEILKSLRRNPATEKLPVILLSSEEARDSIVSAAKLGAQGYLLKSQFSLKDLLARIQQYAPTTGSSKPGQAAHAPQGGTVVVTPGSVPQLLTRAQFLKRVESAMQAKTLSGVVSQVISLATSPRTELADLAALVSRDTVLATRVLQAANSTAYRSAKRSVTTISDAIRQVGCSTIRNIAAAVGIFHAMPETSPDGFNPIRCWQHSFAVAQLCESFATTGGQNSGVAYLIGLCHDLGEIILHTQFGPEYQQIIEMEKTTGKSRDELTFQMLGLTHGEVVSTILRCFGLPEAVRAPIEWFHANGKGMSLGSPCTFEGIIRIAEWYANGVLLASSENAQLNLLTAAQCKSAVGTDVPQPDTEKLRCEIMALTGMLARLSPSEEAELMKPLLGQIDKKLWIARDAALSPLDPISAVFSCLTHAQIKERLPTTVEMVELDGLVILGGNAIQEVAKAFRDATTRSIPTLRIMPASAEREEPESIRCPVTLSQLNTFCSTLVAKKKAA